MEFNVWTMIIAVVLIGAISSTIQTYITRNRPRHRPRDGVDTPAIDVAEVRHLTDEVRVLRERVAVLERIATDRPMQLEHEIERLRDR